MPERDCLNQHVPGGSGFGWSGDDGAAGSVSRWDD